MKVVFLRKSLALTLALTMVLASVNIFLHQAVYADDEMKYDTAETIDDNAGITDDAAQIEAATPSDSKPDIRTRNFSPSSISGEYKIRYYSIDYKTNQPFEITDQIPEEYRYYDYDDENHFWLDCEPESIFGLFFVGWLENNYYSISYIAKGESGDKEIYADWGAYEFGIGYLDHNGEEIINLSYQYNDYRGYNYYDRPFTPPTSPEPYTRIGYTFVGWSSEIDGEVEAQFDFNALGDKNLYAIWDVDEYIITYYDHEAQQINDIPPLDFTIESGIVTIPAPTYDYPDYTFKGWSKAANSTTVDYASGSYKITEADLENLSLYAVWEANVYTISYYGSYNDTFTISDIADVNNAWQAPIRSSIEASVSKSGFLFKGWTDGTNEYTNIGEIVKINKSLDMYAIWEATLTYDANGGQNAPVDDTVYSDHATIALAEQGGMHKPGHLFEGWANSAAAIEADYTGGGSYDFQGSATLHAVWKVEAYGITYIDGENDITSTMGSAQQTYTYNENTDFAILPPTATKPGYTFNGWSETEAGEDIINKIPAGETGAKTFYAQWQPNTYRIVYKNSIGNIVEETRNPASFVFGSSVTLGTIPEDGREDYYFAGWTIEDSQSVINFGKKIQSRNVIFTAEDINNILDIEAGAVTLIAMWTSISENPLNTYDYRAGWDATDIADNDADDALVEIDKEYEISVVSGGLPAWYNLNRYNQGHADAIGGSMSLTPKMKVANAGEPEKAENLFAAALPMKAAKTNYSDSLLYNSVEESFGKHLMWLAIIAITLCTSIFVLYKRRRKEGEDAN